MSKALKPRVLIAPGLVVFTLSALYYIFVSNEDPSASETVNVICPTTDTFSTIWNQWSYVYINDNPYAGVNEQMESWNALMVQNGCSEEWFDPLADLIEQQATSGTPVYWYTE